MLVLDTNILIRAVLGRQVLSLLLRYGPSVDLAAPDFAYDEAHERLPPLLHKRRLDEATGIAVLTLLAPLVDRLESKLSLPFEAEARAVCGTKMTGPSSPALWHSSVACGPRIWTSLARE